MHIDTCSHHISSTGKIVAWLRMCHQKATDSNSEEKSERINRESSQ